MNFLKIIDQMRRLSSTEFKIMEDRFIKLRLSKMCQLQTNMVKLLVTKDRCFLDHIECFQGDLVCPEPLETLRQSLRSMEVSQELSVLNQRFHNLLFKKLNMILLC